jgi:penicillin-binding protein 2
MNETPTYQNTLNLKRIYIFAGLLVVIFLIYVFRLFNFQILQIDQWSARAEENRTRIVNIPAPRGIIYDRNGYILARNIPSYNIVITPASLPGDRGEVQEIFRNLSRLTGVPVSLGELSEETPYVPCRSEHGIDQIVEFGRTTAPYNPVRIQCDVDESIAQTVQEKSIDMPGVGVEVEPLRDYPTGSLTSTIVGYLGPISEHNEAYYRGLGFDPNRDKIGFAGVERTFQEILAGQNGRRVVEWDAAGKIIRDLQEPIPPIPGHNIKLTIDSRLQGIAEAVLIDNINWWTRHLDRIRITSGSVIVMNPQTGEILAMVSYPSYENNRFARFIPTTYYEQLTTDPRAPLLNHAVGDVLPVGSVFKLVTAVGALNEGVVTTSQVIDTPGILNICERYSPNAPCQMLPFYDHNWKVGGFGQMTFVPAIAYSSNVYFYKLGGGYQNEVPEGLGICRLGAYARAMGFGDAAGVGLPDEEKGLIPDPEYKRQIGESWTIGDSYLASVGQGYVLATPIQVLLSGAVIANDGKLMNPTILKEVLDGEGNVIQPFVPDMRWDITVDPVIKEYEAEFGIRGCQDAETGNFKTVDPFVIEKIQEGMRLTVTEGTLARMPGYAELNVAVAGKTGTAEYCDKWAIEARDGRMCDRGDWPSHAWTVAYAPYDNPEIAVVVFAYNGGEGASTAGPIVARIIDGYFRMKAADNILLTGP